MERPLNDGAELHALEELPYMDSSIIGNLPSIERPVIRLQDIQRLREFTPEVIDQLAHLYMNSFNGPPWHEQWKESSARIEIVTLIKSEGEFFIYRGSSNQIFGQSIGMQLSKSSHRDDFNDFDTSGNVYYFAEFCVAPEAQGKGLGTELLRAACDSAELAGYTSVITRTRHDNYSAIKAFERVGFTYLGETPAETGGASSLRVVYKKVF